MKNAARKYSTLRQAGFTLIELLIVVVILGILGTVGFVSFGSGVTSTSTAMQYYTFASRATDTWSQMVSAGRLSHDPTSANPFFEGSNDLLDVLVGGEDMVSSTYKHAYSRSGVTTIEDAVQVAQYPTAGSKGRYTMGGPNTEVSVSLGNGREVLWSFTAVSADVVDALLVENEPSAQFVEGGSNDNRRIRYSSESGGLYTVNIVTRVR